MAAWALGAAIESLRSIIGDHHTDKFVYGGMCTPTPDGFTTKFFAGETRIVDGSFEVRVGPSGVSEDDIIDFDEKTGVFELATAPPANVPVQASFYYQWFLDEQLKDYIEQAITVLGFEDIDDTTFPVGLRSASLYFAAAGAFVSKAAEYADSLSGSAPLGYSVDRKSAAPNWTKLAELMFETGKSLLKVYTDNPLAVAKTPTLSFASFQLPDLVPRS